ncbi:MAG: NUDIX hydrolase [Hyphomicrobiaceae bacterium]|nr:NUDIX hydrolase [Hyphomicrobiaceae bacterium]
MTTSKPRSEGDPAKARTMRPRDAATLIIVDRAAGAPRVLMGRRRMDQVFLPGKYVFPGGGVDASDRSVESADELRPAEIAKLLIDMKGGPSPTRARALGLAAIRETFEEAGLLIGAPAQGPATPIDVPGWSDFFACGYRPKLGALSLFARAITPPGRPRRYDTRFFCVTADEIGHRIETSDGELSGLHWLTIDEARSLDLPAITRVVLEDLTDHLKAAQRGTGPIPVPYYHHRKGTFRRELLSVAETPAKLDSSGGRGMVRPSSIERA